jgi:hypothetical protein
MASYKNNNYLARVCHTNYLATIVVAIISLALLIMILQLIMYLRKCAIDVTLYTVVNSPFLECGESKYASLG